MPADQREEDVARGWMGEGFDGAQGLMNMEAKHLLANITEDRKRDNPNWQPNKVFTDAYEYVNHLPSASSGAVINSIREKMADKNLSVTEVALVGNLMPENTDEAKTLIMSLDNEQHISEQDLQELLDELIKLQNLPGG